MLSYGIENTIIPVPAKKEGRDMNIIPQQQPCIRVGVSLYRYGVR